MVSTFFTMIRRSLKKSNTRTQTLHTEVVKTTRVAQAFRTRIRGLSTSTNTI